MPVFVAKTCLVGKAVARIFVREGFDLPSPFLSALPSLSFLFLPFYFPFLALFLISLPRAVLSPSEI